MKIRTEIWKDHEIRFVEQKGEWWGVAADVCKPLGLTNVTRALKGLPTPGVTTSKVGVVTGTKKDGTPAIQEVEVNIINELNIYRLVFKSRKPEAEAFQDWVFNVLKELRQSTGLEGFQVFRMMDKEHQKEAMLKLRDGLKKPVRVDFIKANTITNKAISTKHGHEKMVKKAEMTPEMLLERQPILEETVELMRFRDKYGMDISVSKIIYDKYTH